MITTRSHSSLLLLVFGAQLSTGCGTVATYALGLVSGLGGQPNCITFEEELAITTEEPRHVWVRYSGHSVSGTLDGGQGTHHVVQIPYINCWAAFDKFARRILLVTILAAAGVIAASVVSFVRRRRRGVRDELGILLVLETALAGGSAYVDIRMVTGDLSAQPTHVELYAADKASEQMVKGAVDFPSDGHTTSLPWENPEPLDDDARAYLAHPKGPFD